MGEGEKEGRRKRRMKEDGGISWLEQVSNNEGWWTWRRFVLCYKSKLFQARLENFCFYFF